MLSTPLPPKCIPTTLATITPTQSPSPQQFELESNYFQSLMHHHLHHHFRTHHLPQIISIGKQKQTYKICSHYHPADMLTYYNHYKFVSNDIRLKHVKRYILPFKKTKNIFIAVSTTNYESSTCITPPST